MDFHEMMAAAKAAPKPKAPKVEKTLAEYGINPSDYPVKGVPMPHQGRALSEAGEKRGHAYWADPGAGKSFVSIAEAGKLFLEGKIDGMLVIAPNGPHRQWVLKEFPKWAAFPFVAMHNKFTPTQQKAFWTRATNPDAMGVLSMNFESTITPKGKALINKFFKRYKRTFMVIDESHRIKSPVAARTKVAHQIAPHAAYVRCLTGTHILKGPEDLWAQYRALGHGPLCLKDQWGNETEFASYSAFRNFFCNLAPVPGNPKAKRIVGYKNQSVLNSMTHPYATVIYKDEFHKSDPLFMDVECDMEPDQARRYKTMQEELLAVVDGGLVTAQNVLVQMTKLLQIASGFIINEDGEVEWFSDAKVKAVLDLCETLDEKAIIFAPFNAMQDRLAEALGDDVVHYKKPADVDRWDRPSGARFLLGHQGSGLGIGMNLQRACATLYTGNTFAAEHRWQSIARTDRIGQENQCRYWDFVAPGTLDISVRENLQAKRDMRDGSLEALRGLLI